jgi:hypothetical protein
LAKPVCLSEHRAWRSHASHCRRFVKSVGYSESRTLGHFHCQALKIDRAKAQEMLNEMDANGDGKV